MRLLVLRGSGGGLISAASGVGFFVDGDEGFVVDIGVTLGRAEGGVTEEFLNLAQIHAFAEKVGGEAVAQGVGRDGGGKAKQGAHIAERFLRHALIEALAFDADEQRPVRRFGGGAMGAVSGDARRHCVQIGHHALLVAFAHDAEHAVFDV